MSKILTSEFVSPEDTTQPNLDTIPFEPDLTNEGGSIFKVRRVAQVMPKLENLGTFLQNNIRFDYDIAAEFSNPIVYLQFIVLEDGNLYNVEVLSSPHPALTRSALSAMYQMPKWTPGMHNGNPVKVQLTLPIRFRTY